MKKKANGIKSSGKNGKAKRVSETEAELQEAQAAGSTIPRATPAQEKDIALWRKLNIIASHVKPKLEDVKERIVVSITELGVEAIDTKAGPIKLQTKMTTDWKAFALAHVDPGVIDRVDWELFARGELGKDLVAQFAAERVETHVTWESLVRLSLPAATIAEKQEKYTELAKFTKPSDPFLSAPPWFRKAS